MDSRYRMLVNDRHVEREGQVRCDALGCTETHPLEHEALGEPSFGTGRWLGWVYLDLNRPDLFGRPLRFCSVSCCQWWLEREVITRGNRPLSPLDEALRAPDDQLKRRRARRRP
jgi:hypothetical protein